MLTKIKKIHRLGNSGAVIIDSFWLKEHGLQIGDHVLVEMSEKVTINADISTKRRIHKKSEA